jgi:hypothetical protein
MGLSNMAQFSFIFKKNIRIFFCDAYLVFLKIKKL